MKNTHHIQVGPKHNQRTRACPSGQVWRFIRIRTSGSGEERHSNASKSANNPLPLAPVIGNHPITSEANSVPDPESPGSLPAPRQLPRSLIQTNTRPQHGDKHEYAQSRFVPTPSSPPGLLRTGAGVTPRRRCAAIAVPTRAVRATRETGSQLSSPGVVTWHLWSPSSPLENARGDGVRGHAARSRRPETPSGCPKLMRRISRRDGHAVGTDTSHAQLRKTDPFHLPCTPDTHLIPRRK